ncbi:hypothetical protein AK812_SmicGene25585 [Symbiodinium microadriaticum]|uniref:Uncharacterized protein n=1 Tax=Symbiodinium microadriaticum TaxID=2951 RepID=A0A1Q9DBI0_SYMMI|nr:hypothetical protein AK812_SmicGene25585 [Symbiodinium microadriaticum]
MDEDQNFEQSESKPACNDMVAWYRTYLREANLLEIVEQCALVITVPKPFNKEKELQFRLEFGEFRKRQLRVQEKVAAFQKEHLGKVDPAVEALRRRATEQPVKAFFAGAGGEAAAPPEPAQPPPQAAAPPQPAQPPPQAAAPPEPTQPPPQAAAPPQPAQPPPQAAAPPQPAQPPPQAAAPPQPAQPPPQAAAPPQPAQPPPQAAAPPEPAQPPPQAAVPPEPAQPPPQVPPEPVMQPKGPLCKKRFEKGFGFERFKEIEAKNEAEEGKRSYTTRLRMQTGGTNRSSACPETTESGSTGACFQASEVTTPTADGIDRLLVLSAWGRWEEKLSDTKERFYLEAPGGRSGAEGPVTAVL